MEIVGLKKFVQDGVNKLIAKFVGFPVHPLVKLLRDAICFKEKCEVYNNPDLVLILFRHLSGKSKEKRFWEISKTIWYLW